MKFFDTNDYKFNSNSKNGVYIIHGFTNTTFETRDLAKYLGNQGFNINAINLPGHGTTPEDCNRIKYSDWIEYTEKGIAEMSVKCDNVFVVGISMGADLALHLSSIFPLRAAVYASTVLQFKDYIGVRLLTPIFHRLKPFREKKLSYPKRIRDKIHYYGYKVWPLSAVNEMRKLTNIVKKELPKIKCPSLIIHSKNDKLALQSNPKIVYNSISSLIKEEFIVEKASHNLFLPSPEQDLIFNKIAKFFKKFIN